MPSAREDGFKTVKYHELPIVLLGALQELSAENDRQEEEAARLREVLEQQQTQLRALQVELAALKARLKERDAPLRAATGQQ